MVKDVMPDIAIKMFIIDTFLAINDARGVKVYKMTQELPPYTYK